MLNLIVRCVDDLRESGSRISKRLYVCINRIISIVIKASSYQVLNHSSYLEKYHNGGSTSLFVKREGYSSNLVYNDSTEEQRLIPCPLSDIELYHYKDLIISGDSDILIDTQRNIAINDLCCNKDERIIYYDSVKLAQKKNTILLRYLRVESEIASGIVLSGLFSNNYYHSIYDNMLRIVAIQESSVPADVPYLIDRATYEISSLRTVFQCLTQKRNRSFVILEKGRAYRVGDLYYVSHVNYMIPSIKSYDLCKPTDTVFDLNLTLKMREQLLSIKSDKTFPEKFFISRKHTSRRNFNEDEVFSVLQKEGFERVFPEDLTFEEQIALFNNAKIIVGGGGAAMTNLMFCNKGCKVLIINKTMDQVPCFTTMPYAIGVKIRHYGQENNDKRLHSDYMVNPQGVYNCLKILLSDDRDSNNHQT